MDTTGAGEDAGGAGGVQGSDVLGGAVLGGRVLDGQAAHRSDAAAVLVTWRECWAAPLHLAVTHGPDAGWLLPLDRTVTVGRRGSELEIADPALDHRHLTLRPDADGVVHVRDERTVNGTVLLRPARRPGGRRRRQRRLARALRRGDGSALAVAAAIDRASGPGARVTHRWRTVAVGDELVAGSSRFEVRAGPAHGGRGTAGVRESGDGGLRYGENRRGGGRHRLTMVLTLLPAVAVLGLMVGGGASPALRWVMLGGIGVSVVVTLVVGARNRRVPARSRPGSGPPGEARPPGGTDPAALALGAAGLGRVDERWPSAAAGAGGVGGVGGLRGFSALGATATATVSAVIDLDAGTVLSSGGAVLGPADPDGPVASAHRLTVPPAGLAVSGDGADGVARWLRAQLDVAGHDGVPVLAAPTSAGVPPGPWTRIDAAGRCGVAPLWRRTLLAALSPTALPSELTALLGRPTTHGIASAWAGSGTWTDTLAVPLGLDPTGRPRLVDLVADGPHALVAGTTGSGKSELLAAWAIAMAVRHPPRRLQLLLVDYKGGATFAAAADLPHTVGLLTDLDSAASDRALTALRAELRRREHLVAAAGARGIEELTEPPARLVVVVDELRALVEDSPDRLGDLVRLATQGRSLGVHLVLATQRPSGVVNAQLRANVNLRLSLRVLDPGDSTDVIGVPDACQLPLAPGGAYVQSGAAPVRLQVAWLPGPAAQELVAVVRGAADRSRRARREDLLRVHRPWLPDLPAVVGRRALGALARGSALDEGGPAGPERTALLLVDEPDRQRRSLWSWDGGVVLVSGEPRSGRTTALQTLAAVEAAAGRGCHVVSREGWSPGREPGTAVGTTVPTTDPRRLQRLLSLLAHGADPGSSLVVDDVEQVVEAIDGASGPGAGQELLTALLRSGHVSRVALATTAPHRWASFAAHHVALRVRDVGAAGLVGVPRALVRAGAPPGRGVLLGGEESREVQVVLDDDPSDLARSTVTGQHAAPRGLVLAPLPTLVRLADLVVPSLAGAPPPSRTRTEPWRPVLGVGGDDAGVVAADLVPGRPWLVCGPASSGRTEALRVIAAQCEDPVVLVSPESPLDAAAPPVHAVILVDDAELLDPATADALAGLAVTHRAVVATSATATQTVYRGIVASVAQARTVLALGGTLPAHCAHARAARDSRGGVGRAVLVTGTGVVPIQMAHR
ncbi:FtsK/SpoIIIE domain-containing protein [Serinibacter arcticus]|uniref:Cell division protein FtsK n=1 Tax=Serinibacter arcticus TaxID=1655435 RepID=A0A4Z1E5I1_9MICO|nr:FtsK/SpoIIIE domain-containing protein [Serinibacter arcticus]TGO06138.1 Cell division protein FtsK [Serinibacter arcticus]